MYLKITNNGHSEDIIRLLKRSYRMIFLLLLFIKPFYEKDNAIRVLSREVINIKLFIFMMVIFICMESERVEIIPLLNCVLFYLCHCFKNDLYYFNNMVSSNTFYWKSRNIYNGYIN